MSLINPSLDWQKLSDVYYSIRTCYDELSWQLEDIYTNHRFAVSPNTTLLALASRFVPHPNVINIYSLSGTQMWSLVYNSSSASTEYIVDFAFHEESLCVVLANNKVRVYTDFLGTFEEYSSIEGVIAMSTSATKPTRSSNISHEFKYVITNLEDNSIEHPRLAIECKVWGSYLMIRYTDRFSFMDMRTFSVYEVPFPSLLHTGIHAICLISAQESSLTFIMSYDETIYTINCDFTNTTYEFADEQLTDGPFTIISASANGQLVALLGGKNARIFVTTCHFNKMLLEYDTANESSVPYMMEWAGNDAIILSLRDEIKLIGPGQKSVSFFYDIVEDEDLDFDKVAKGNLSTTLAFTIPIIIREVDGLKIVTSNKIEFLSRVSASSVNLFEVGSSHPSYILLDCVDKMEMHASKADSNISLLKSEGTLVDAINGCLDAALEEFSPDLQTTIMKAACFGKIYVDHGFNSDNYLKVVDTLHVLNHLRSPEIGLFLTHAELGVVGWPAVIQMLLNRSLHLLALSIVELLRLEECRANIYVHWCCTKIRLERKMSDIELFTVVAKKLLSARKKRASPNTSLRESKPPSTTSDRPSLVHMRNLISTKKIFDVALQEGRLDLCKLIVHLEPSSVLRVKQLLNIDEVNLALIQCFQTCDYNFCVSILRHLKETLSLTEFQRVLNQNELVEVISADSMKVIMDDDELRPYFEQDLFVSGALIGNLWKQSTAKYDKKLLEEYFQITGKTAEHNVYRLRSYMKHSPVPADPSGFTEVYQARKKELQSLLSDKALKSIVQGELECLELRYKLSTTYQESFFEQDSVADVIKKLVQMHQLKPAARVVKDFKMTQAKLWYIVLETYCKSGNFEWLNKFIEDANSGNTVHKSPIGFEEIVNTCFAYKCPKEYISTYIKHCTKSSYQERVKLYLKNNDPRCAAEEAFNNKDVSLLRSVQTSVDRSEVDTLTLIESYIHRMGGRS